MVEEKLEISMIWTQQELESKITIRFCNHTISMIKPV